jgi:hypothetical protein
MERLLIALLFIAGLYYYTHSAEGMFNPARCPNVLIADGNEIQLRNTHLAEIPGVNPIIFHNLEEYTEFVRWQRSKGLPCPVLFLRKSYNAQNEPVYVQQPTTLLYDANRDDPPYNTNSYPGMDQMNQTIGLNTPLDSMPEPTSSFKP